MITDELYDKLSERGKDWHEFNTKVLKHIENYTVPQYGDKGNDQATEFGLNEIKVNMLRYINRMGRNARGTDEALRDMLKVAHYAQMAYDLIQDDRWVSTNVYEVKPRGKETTVEEG